MRPRLVNCFVGSLCCLCLMATACVPFGQNAPAVPDQAAEVRESDLSDALLLYTSDNRHISEWGFQKVTDFYGLKRAEVDLKRTPLTDALLRDQAGAYYPTVFIDAKTLDSVLGRPGIDLLKRATRSGSVNLLVSALQSNNSPALRQLTNNELLGSTKLLDSHQDYLISNDFPQITRELTGLKLAHDSPQLDYGLTIAPNATHVNILTQATDDAATQYPIFARYQNGSGSVFALSSAVDQTLKFNRLEWHYRASRERGEFSQQHFSQLVPTMMFVRFSGGDETWHRDQDYANFTLDDPALQSSKFDYQGILQQAIAHDFHFTVAMPPKYYDTSDPTVTELFLAYPNRLSVVQHGNNHDGYEFFKYAAEPGDEYPPRPLDLQEENIVEGRTRMEAHLRRTGIAYAPVMIFPYNIAPLETLMLLKQYNYQATINSLDVPLGVKRANQWDSYMYPAELAYNSFAVIGRSGPGADPYPFELFIDHPVLIYGHKDMFDKNGIEALNPISDAINGLSGEVEWQSIDQIAKHLYLQKNNDDGSTDVMFFGNNVIITNDTDEQRVFHLRRKEDGHIPIHSVIAADTPVDYAVVSDSLQISLPVPAQTSREIRIVYGTANKDFTLSAADITLRGAQTTGKISANIHNQGGAAGPVSVEIFDGDPETGGLSVGIATAHRIEPGGSGEAKLDSVALNSTTICVVADPYDIILESDEANNTACIDTLAARANSQAARQPGPTAVPDLASVAQLRQDASLAPTTSVPAPTATLAQAASATSTRTPPTQIGKTPTPAQVATSTLMALRVTTSPSPALPQGTLAALAVEEKPATQTPAALGLPQRVAAAEAALQSGDFAAELSYTDGSRAVATLRFDLGNDQNESRFHITTTYLGTGGRQTVERISIGDQAWDLQPDGRWVRGPSQAGVFEQIRRFLPGAVGIHDPEVVIADGTGELRWYDPGADADATLLVDSVQGIPRQLRRVARRDGSVFAVTYKGWNTTVEITPPI
jgi:hypothetical protein